MKQDTVNNGEQRETLAKMLDAMDLAVIGNIRDLEPTFNDMETISYIFFIRIIETFQGIVNLVLNQQIVPATMLLRPLAESFILMKSSMFDEDFNDRHIKRAALEKERWLKNAIRHLDKNGFGKDKDFFDEIKSKTAEIHTDIENDLQQTLQLFEKQNELEIYFQIYSPSNFYVHSNRHSFNHYHSAEGGVKPVAERDYSRLYRHTCLGAALIMLKAYKLFVQLARVQEPITEELKRLMEACAAKAAGESKPI